MITVLIVCCLVLIPTVLLLLYGIGLLLPASHTVSRSATYNTTAEIVWAILTSVQDYPAWRHNIDRVTIRHDDFESDINKYEDDSRLTFIEYTAKKDRRTVIVHIEQEKERKLLRVIEERPYITPGEERDTFTNSNFSGSWTFTIEPQDEKQVELKITEHGTIKKPMVRAFYTLFFGFNRRIDRFLKDLGKEIDLGFLEEQVNEEEQAIEEQQVFEEQVLEEEEEEEEKQVLEQQVLEEEEEEEEPSQPNLTESKMLDKEWDMMSEIYEKKAV